MTSTLAQRVAAEALGTAFLLATVVGSGVMAQKLAGGDAALALLGNTIPTGAILVVLILIFAPISGAHMNPAVSLGDDVARRTRPRANSALSSSRKFSAASSACLRRTPCSICRCYRFRRPSAPGAPQWLAEAVATFGLVLTILGCQASAPLAVPYAVGLYITAAYWFTASTSFANPAVTLARALTDTFSGIAPAGVPAFIVAQLLGMLAAVAVSPQLWPTRPREASA